MAEKLKRYIPNEEFLAMLRDLEPDPKAVLDFEQRQIEAMFTQATER